MSHVTHSLLIHIRLSLGYRIQLPPHSDAALLGWKLQGETFAQQPWSNVCKTRCKSYLGRHHPKQRCINKVSTSQQDSRFTFHLKSTTYVSFCINKVSTSLQDTGFTFHCRSIAYMSLLPELILWSGVAVTREKSTSSSITFLLLLHRFLPMLPNRMTVPWTATSRREHIGNSQDCPRSLQGRAGRAEEQHHPANLPGGRLRLFASGQSRWLE